MSGKREASGRPRRVTYANVIIALCLLVSLGITAAVVWEYHRLDEPMSAGVVTALLGLWGGELLIVALRQIFGSDVTRRNQGADTGGFDGQGSI